MEDSAPEEKEAAPKRPDWLVGADEGVAAETDRVARAKAEPAAPVRLIRPQGEEPPAPAASRVPPGENPPDDHGALDLTGDPAPDTPVAREALSISSLNARRTSEKAPDKKKAWTAKASSVPRLRLVPTAGSAAPKRADPSPEPEAPDEVFPDDDAEPTAAAPVPMGVTAVARPRVAPAPVLREAWWAVALDAVRSERKVQLLIGLVVVGVLGIMFLRPADDQRVSVGSIRKDPDRFDGRIVTVGGKVGEVFQVGGGYAFYLHDGRDTLVVFTRSRTPEPRQSVSVKGSISTGFLDGLPRQALFEQ